MLKIRRKLKIATVHINTVSEQSITTGARLARYMSIFFDCPFIHNRKTAIIHKDEYDILFIKFGILKFCDYREELFYLYKNAKRIIALEEDYTMGPDYRLTQLNPSLEIWTSIPDRLKEIQGVYINWNRMTWRHNPHWETEKRKTPSIKGLGYFGSYRPGREKYFKRYFTDNIYSVTVSTFPRNKLKFFNLNPQINIVAPFHDRRQIAAFQSILYIEDEFSHEHYTSPANRFYECLSNFVPLIFDLSCHATFQKAGYDITHYTVQDSLSMSVMLKQTDEIARNQRQLWYRNYQNELYEDIKKVVTTEIGAWYGLHGNYPNI